jgi:DNA-binding beta-propeller fold protein YncE
VIVADLGTSQVLRLDMTTCTSEPIAQFFFPTGLAASDDDLWAADWVTGTVRQLVRDGTTTDEVVASGLIGPEGMAVTPDGDLVVLEAAAHRLSLIDLPTGTVTPLVEGLAVGQPAPAGLPPHWTFEGVAVGDSGAIYVASGGIQRYQIRP